jgi:hypothetical protein
VPRRAENIAEFVRRGGALYGDSRLVGVLCCDCRRPFLLDESDGRVFLDPADLRRVADDEDDDLPCPGCGRADWEVEDVPAHELTGFVRGRWAFAFWSPPAVRPPRSTARKVAVAIAIGTLAVIGVAAVAVNPDPFAAPGHGRPQVQVPAGP